MNKLTPADFSFKCPMKWDDMTSTDHGKFCGKCRKEVFDLTNCSVDEVIELQRKHGQICGSIKVAAVAISLSAAACQNQNPSRHDPDAIRLHGTAIRLDHPATPPSGDTATSRNSIDGIICPPKELMENHKGMVLGKICVPQDPEKLKLTDES